MNILLLSSAPERQLVLALPLIKDEGRDVRVAAASIVANLPLVVADPSADLAISEAHDVWRQHLRNSLDRPESRMGLAALHIKLGEFSQAEDSF